MNPIRLGIFLEEIMTQGILPCSQVAYLWAWKCRVAFRGE
jgi:hypothetical protein